MNKGKIISHSPLCDWEYWISSYQPNTPENTDQADLKAIQKVCCKAVENSRAVSLLLPNLFDRPDKSTITSRESESKWQQLQLQARKTVKNLIQILQLLSLEQP
jgi:hypothetical protein